MKKNNLKTRITMLAATLALCGSMVTPAMAGTTYTPVAGTSCNFNKFLIMDAGDTVPNVSFAFTIAPGTARSVSTADNASMQVSAGVGTPTIANVTFSDEDTTATTAGSNIDVARQAVDRAAGLTAATGVQLESGEKYATQQATVDFSSVNFTEPGIYRYVITETANATHEAAGIMHDNDVDRILDVYVTDDGNGTLVVSAYVLHKNDSDVVLNTTSMGSGDVSTAAEALGDKTDGFTNEYNSKDLKIQKSVTGNQASRDKYFEFTVTATNVNDDDVYAVSIADDNDASTNDGSADATSGSNAATIDANAGKTNPATVTGAALKAGQKFYLQHGQSIVIRGLAPDAGYTVTENAEDYASAVMTGKTNTGTIGTVAGSNKMAEAGFTNTRNGVIPTGVAVTVLPGLALAALGGAGLLASKKKKREDEE